jgi:Obg family GTPase CgtA
MKFVDEASIYVEAGRGGRGSVSFRRSKFIPRGGPDGGDGGKGGDVIVAGKSNLASLLDFKYKRNYKAENGKPGGGQNKTGRNGTDSTPFMYPWVPLSIKNWNWYRFLLLRKTESDTLPHMVERAAEEIPVL